MAKQVIQLGSSINDGQGDPLRTAFTKVNENFTELYSALATDMSSLATVATTGSYNDLIDKPTLTTNSLTNGGHNVTLGSDGYLTTESVHIQGYLKGVDGNAGSPGQVLTVDPDNGGVYWSTPAAGNTGDIRFNGTWIKNVDTGNIYISPQDGYTWLNLPSDAQATSEPVVLYNATSTGLVQIGAGNKQWNFNYDGNLTLPQSNSGAAVLSSGTAGLQLLSNSHSLQFSPDGSIIIPNGDATNGGQGQIFSANESSFINLDVQFASDVLGGIRLGTATATPVDILTNYNGGAHTWRFGADGTLTIPGPITGLNTGIEWTATITGINLGTQTYVNFSTGYFGGPVRGQIIISGVIGTSQVNNTWYYEASNYDQIALYTDSTYSTEVNSSEWPAYESGGTAENINSGGFTLEANSRVWDFNANGNLSVPGNLIIGGGNTGEGNEQHLVIDSSNYWTSIQWKNFDSPQDPNNTPFECQAQLLRVFATENTVTGWCNVNSPREELVALTAIRPNVGNYNGWMLSTSNGKIPDAPYNDGTGTRYDWLLHGDGTTQFPNMSTNSRTGSADALVFSRDVNVRWGQKAIATQSGTASHNTVERLVIAGGDSYFDGTTWSGEGGDLYLWAGRGADGGDIKVDAGNAEGSGYGGNIKIRGGHANGSVGDGGFLELIAGNSNAVNGGYINITAGNGAVNGGNLTLSAGYGANSSGIIQLNTQGHSCTFDNNGAFSAPLFLAATGTGGNNGYSFQGDGGYDTGMFSTQDGYVQFYANTQEVLNFNTDRLQINKPVTFDVSNQSGSGDPAYPTALDLTKTINKISDNAGSYYTLADGFEGQIMYLVKKHNVTDYSYGSIHILVANPYYGVNQLTNQNLYFGSGQDLITLLFTDGAWQQSGGIWD